MYLSSSSNIERIVDFVVDYGKLESCFKEIFTEILEQSDWVSGYDIEDLGGAIEELDENEFSDDDMEDFLFEHSSDILSILDGFDNGEIMYYADRDELMEELVQLTDGYKFYESFIEGIYDIENQIIENYLENEIDTYFESEYEHLVIWI